MIKKVLATLLLSTVCFSGYPQTKKRPTPIAVKRPDTVTVALVQPNQLKETIILDSTSIAQIEKTTNKGISWKDPAIIIQVAGLAAAILAGWLAWRTFRRDKSYRDQSFLIDYNKLMIEHPELRAYKTINKNDFKFSIECTVPAIIDTKEEELILVMGNHSFTVTAGGKVVTYKNGIDANYHIPKDARIDIQSAGKICLQSGTDKSLLTKVEAYCHYKLNYFELVFNLSGGKEKNIKAWENYFKYLYDESEIFKSIVSEAVGKDAAIYSEKFVKKIKKILKTREQT
jgi:hypothetical protein